MIEETFFLYPPDWLKTPPNPESTKLFKTYTKNAPAGTWPANTTTHQGLYTMTANGDYLSGKFANPSKDAAHEILESGLNSWKSKTENAKPVPTDRLELYGGEPLQKGGIKLEVVYRDLPRGDIERPSDSRFPNPYNLGWFDFSPSEAKAFLAEKGEKKEIPSPIFSKLACAKLKDSVRGQMGDWKAQEMQSGQLFSELITENGSVKTYQLTGNAKFSSGDRSYEPTLQGEAIFDTSTGEFTEFKLIAAGQRTGRGGANGRSTDLGPAPMGVGFWLYKK
ncbi:MAG: hypothetical protein ACKVJU_14150 [Verrucomicrobiales bacterium]